ncbi:MAG: hypothetical protein JJE51_07820 [Thermoanaerobaculia bacterium]|nr:hypothetical protein [Thermoanaerobaculia bacterium]
MSTWESISHGGETRVTLRAERFDRWVTSIVYSLSLFIWWGVDLFLVNLVLAYIPLAWRIPAPPGVEEMVTRSAEGERPSIFIIIVLALFATAWTLAGIKTLGNLLRLLFGSDSVVMAPGGIRIKRAIGPFGITRELQRDAIRSIAIRGRARQLEAESGGKRFIIATLGTEADRRRLGGDLRSRYQLMTPAERSGDQLPARWEASRHAAGGFTLQTPRAGRRSLIGCSAAPSVAWWLLVAFRFYMKNLRDEPLAPTAGDWIAIAIGLILAALPFIAARSRTSIEVGRNSLVIARTIGPWKSRSDFRDASLNLVFHSNRSSSDDLFQLEVGRGDKWSTLAAATNDATDLLLLGRFLAAETGWSLDIAPQAREVS